MPAPPMSDSTPQPGRTAPDGPDPLAVGPDAMREMARAVVEMLVDEEAGLRQRPVVKATTAPSSPHGSAARRRSAAGRSSRSWPSCASTCCRLEAGWPTRPTSPTSPGAATFPGALGDLIASALNIEASNWLDSPGPSHLELTVLRWFADWIGYPAEAEGILVSGGSAANLTALACAREALVGSMRDDLVTYASDQAHSSVARAARTLGFRPDQLRIVPVDVGTGCVPTPCGGRSRPIATRPAAADRLRRRRVDQHRGDRPARRARRDLPRERRLAARRRRVRRVRGAQRPRQPVAGGASEAADSVTLDPHKWLHQPFECGCVLVRDGRLLEDAFRIAPDYLKDARGAQVDFADRGLQLSRMARSLKLWLSISTFGVGAFRTAVDRALDLAQLAERLVAESEQLELMSPARWGSSAFDVASTGISPRRRSRP